MHGFPRSGMNAVVAAAVVAVTAAVAACDGNGTAPPTTGTIEALVTADGSPASGVTVSLFEPGGTTALSTGTTGADGRFSFGEREAGGYEVEVTVPEGMTLDAGAARTAVTVTAGGAATVSFALSTADENGNGNDDDVVEIQLLASSFSPDDVTIAPGTTIRWRNTGNVFHTVTPDGHDEFAREELHAADDVYEHTFHNVGEFDYFCEPHAPHMVGIIRVEAED